jgi:uncharacterized protein
VTDLTTPPTSTAPDTGWLINDFVARNPGIVHAAVVSVDGLLVVTSDNLDRATGDQLAAVAAGLNQMAAGAGRSFGAGDLQQQLIQYQSGYVLLRALASGAVIVAVAARSADMAQVGHELVSLSRQVGEYLSPDLISNLRRQLRT